MSENNLAQRLSDLVKIANDAHRVIGNIDSSLTLVNNLRRLASRENNKDDFRHTVDSLRKAIDAAPHCTELRYQLAKYEVLSGEISDALNNLDMIVRADPEYIVKVLAEPDFGSIRSQIDKMLLEYDKELSEIFFKLFNDVTDTLSQLTMICDNQGLPIIVEPEKLSGYTSRRIESYSIEGEIVGCDWELHGTILRPRNLSVIEEICSDLRIVLSKAEEIVEIYRRGEILSKKLACDLLADISFKSLGKIPFDIKKGRVRLKYRARWQIWSDVPLDWNWPRWGTTTSEGTTDVYVGIGGKRI